MTFLTADDYFNDYEFLNVTSAINLLDFYQLFLER